MAHGGIFFILQNVNSAQSDICVITFEHLMLQMLRLFPTKSANMPRSLGISGLNKFAVHQSWVSYVFDVKLDVHNISTPLHS